MNAKLNKILSVFLSLIILLSSLTMLFLSAVDSNSEYYVKIGGTGDGSSYANAAGSIPAVVATINSDGHKSGDNVTVFIDSRNGSGVVPSKVTSAADVIAYHSTDTPIHTATITYKPYDSNYEALLGYVEYGKTYNQMFLSGPTVFENLTMIDLSTNDYWYGMIYSRGYSVTYRNINWKGISASTGEIKNKDSVSREYYTGNATNGTALSCLNEQRIVWDGAGNTLYRMVFGSRITSAAHNANMHTVNGNLTLELSNTANKANAVFLSHVEPSTNLYMTYKGNVNIVMKNGCYAYYFLSNGAENVNGSLAATENNALYPVVEGAIQVVANAGSKWNHTTPDFTAYSSSDRTSLTPVYKIKNNDKSVVIDVTVNAGEYTVSGDKTVYVARGDKIYYGNKNVNLKVPSAEEYILTSANNVEDIKADNIPSSTPSKVFLGWEDDGNGTLTAKYDMPDVVESEYFIVPEGTGDGRSSLAPAGSIERVIKSINEDGLGFGDIATVYIDGENQPNYWNSDDLNSKFIQFNSSYEHTATLIYTSLDKTKPAKIAFVADYNANGGLDCMFVTGPTVFKDVYLIDQQQSYESSRYTYMNGHNVTFQNVKFLEARNSDAGFRSSNLYSDYRLLYTGGFWWSRWNIDVNSYGIGTGGRVKIDSSVLVNDSGVKQIIYGWDLSGSAPKVQPIFTEDATLEIKGGVLDKLYLTNAKANQTYDCMTYEKNVNLIADKGTVITTFASNKTEITDSDAKKKAAPVVKGAIQVILNGGARIDSNEVYAYTDSSKSIATPIYILSSAQGAGGSLSLTNNVGEYAVTTLKDYYAVAQSTTSEDSYKSVDGILTVPAGEYTVTYVTDVVREPIKKDYYIVPEGTGDGRTELTPAGSVETVIKSVNEDELVEGDTATVYIDGENQPDYWNSDDLNSKFIQFNGNYEHKATIVYKSLNENHPAKIAYVADLITSNNEIGAIHCLYATGPTIFDGVYLIDPQLNNYSSRNTYLNGNNVTFKNVKFYEVSVSDTEFKNTNNVAYGDYTYLYTGSVATGSYSGSNTDFYGLNDGGRLIADDSSLLDSATGFYYGIVYGHDLSLNLRCTDAEFKNDAEIELNGGTLNNLYLTNANNTRYMTYKKNVNLIANKETVINNFLTNLSSDTKENAPIISGAIQLILNDGSTIVNNTAYAYKDDSRTDLTPVYMLSSKKNSGGSLEFTETAGVYKVTAKDGYYAVAQNIDGDGYYVSQNGLLTVPEGKYYVTYTDSPLKYGEIRITVDGKTINGKFRKGSVYTLPAAPAENDDYNFIGYVFNGVTYNPGDKYTINITTGVIDFVASYKLKPQMCYFTNGGDWKGIGHALEVTIGEKYRFEYSVASSFQITPLFTTTGNRYSIIDSKDYVCIEKTEYPDYFHAIYEITVPEKTFKGYDMTEEMICSLSFPANSSGFVFDFSCYNVKDPETELIDNNDFTSGLDGWMFDWSAWFVEGRTGLGLWKWEDGSGRSLEVMKRDLEKIIIHYDDSHFDDGVWWNKSDIYEEYVGKATLCGTLKHSNGSIMKNIKLLLESQEESYTTKTNSKGYFEFSNIVPGFYQLYTVDIDGQMFYTGFVKKIYDKDNYKLEIVCNSSENLGTSDNNDNEDLITDAPNDSNIEDLKTDISDNTDKEDLKTDISDNADNEDLITDANDDSDIEDLKTDISDNDNQTPEEIVPSVGHIKGTVYTPDIKTVPNLKMFIGDICEVVTDSNGCFEASDIPVGEYEIYTIDENGNKYVFRTITIKENVELSVKLKYDILQKTPANDKGMSSIVIISIAVGGVLFAVLVAVLVVIVFKKKKKI